MSFFSAPPLRWLLLLTLCLLSTGRLCAQAPTWQYAGSAGVGLGESTAIDGAGNTYVTGSFRGTATFGAITLTSVGTSDDVFVAKLTSGGVYEWAVRAGGSGDEYSYDVAVDASGNVAIAGGFYSTSIAFGPTTLTNASTSAYDLFVAKLTPTGAWQWATRAGGSSEEGGYGVAVDGAGSVVVTGFFQSPTVSFGATTLVNTTVGNVSIFLTRLSGTTGLPETAAPAGLMLFPNPARTTVQLAGAPGATATLLDGVGRRVRTVPVSAAGTATLDVRALPAGLYLLRAGAATRRLVVE